MSAPIFGQWYYYSLLRSIGWPRKAGFLRREVVDSSIADTVAKNLFDLGRIIGARLPDPASSLLVQAYGTEWSQTAIDGLGTYRETPWPTLASMAKSVPRQVVEGKELQTSLYGRFAAEILYGLGEPDLVAQEFDDELSGAPEFASWGKRHGLSVDPDNIPGSADDLEGMARTYLRHFEEEFGPLPPPSAQLLRLARPTLRHPHSNLGTRPPQATNDQTRSRALGDLPAIPPGRFVMCWGCHILLLNDAELSEHADERHPDGDYSMFEVSHPDEQPVRLSDLDSFLARRAEDAGASAPAPFRQEEGLGLEPMFDALGLVRTLAAELVALLHQGSEAPIGVIISGKNNADRYVQFALSDSDTLLFEAVSNDYLPPASVLTDAELGALAERGFTKPSGPGDVADRGAISNFQKVLDVGTADNRSIQALAEEAISVLDEVYGIVGSECVVRRVT